MPLTRSEETFACERFEGVYFWMCDDNIDVLCMITDEALRERAARDGEDENVERTFVRHRDRIEQIARANYAERALTGDVLLVLTEQLTPLPM
jgi:Protein of unknown function (DUF1488)